MRPQYKRGEANPSVSSLYRIAVRWPIRVSNLVYAACSGAQIKTRKRNIAVPLDPSSFADAVVEIFQDSKEGDDLEKNLQAAVKASFWKPSLRLTLLTSLSKLQRVLIV